MTTEQTTEISQPIELPKENKNNRENKDNTVNEVKTKENETKEASIKKKKFFKKLGYTLSTIGAFGIVVGSVLGITLFSSLGTVVFSVGLVYVFLCHLD